MVIGSYFRPLVLLINPPDSDSQISPAANAPIDAPPMSPPPSSSPHQQYNATSAIFPRTPKAVYNSSLHAPHPPSCSPATNLREHRNHILRLLSSPARSIVIMDDDPSITSPNHFSTAMQSSLYEEEEDRAPSRYSLFDLSPDKQLSALRSRHLLESPSQDPTKRRLPMTMSPRQQARSSNLATVRSSEMSNMFWSRCRFGAPSRDGTRQATR